MVSTAAGAIAAPILKGSVMPMSTTRPMVAAVTRGPFPSETTTAAPAAATGRATPPPARQEHPSAPLPGLRAELAPQTTGMPGWASEPAPPAPSGAHGRR